MKRLETAPYIQMLTVPALDMLADAPAQRRGAPSGSSARSSTAGPSSLGLQYDSRMVAAQIVDGLERARELRIEYAAMLAYNEAMSIAGPGEPRWSSRSPAAAAPLDATSALVDRAAAPGPATSVASRCGRAAATCPGCRASSSSWGPSCSWSTSRAPACSSRPDPSSRPAARPSCILTGPETNLVVPVRFIRSDVARIDGLGVRYHAAAAFAKELDLDGPRRRSLRPGRRRRSSRRLLGAVLANAERERGAGAREVRARAAPARWCA